MLGVDLIPALSILGVALTLAVAVRIALAVGARRARKRGAAILASVPREAGPQRSDDDAADTTSGDRTHPP